VFQKTFKVFSIYFHKEVHCTSYFVFQLLVIFSLYTIKSWSQFFKSLWRISSWTLS